MRDQRHSAFKEGKFRLDANNTAQARVTEQLAAADPDVAEIDLDLSGTSWEFFFQDIVRRSRTLRHVSIATAFTCSKMRADGFGGMATLITPDAIVGKSTGDLIEDFLLRAGLDEVVGRGQEGPQCPKA